MGLDGFAKAPQYSPRTLLQSRMVVVSTRPSRSSNGPMSRKRRDRSASVDSFIGSDASPKGDDYIRAREARERQSGSIPRAPSAADRGPRKKRKVDNRDVLKVSVPVDKGKGRVMEPVMNSKCF